MFTNKQQEILTYNIYKKDNNINICIPVLGLINPKFKLIENNLYIYFSDYNKSFFINNLKEDTIQYIKNEQAYIVESLVYDSKLIHKINLTNK